jgi:hypothetical protein
MTIQQERDIAVAALERIARYPQRRDSELGYTGCRSVAKHMLGEIQRAQALQALVDEGQARGEYDPIQSHPIPSDSTGKQPLQVAEASAVAQDERVLFEAWWIKTKPDLFDNDDLVLHCHHAAMLAYRAGRASVAVPDAQPVGEAVAWRMFSDLNWHFNSSKPPDKFMSMWQPLYTAPLAQDKDATRYRWLRDSKNSGQSIRAIYEDGQSNPADVDKFIDAAMSEAK